MESVTVRGIDFEVTGEHLPYRAATYLQPEEGGYFEVDKIYYKGVEVTDLIAALDGEVFAEISEELTN